LRRDSIDEMRIGDRASRPSRASLCVNFRPIMRAAPMMSAFILAASLHAPRTVPGSRVVAI
jgi:hypothetical protein